jgi:AraC family transcriptional regulator
MDDLEVRFEQLPPMRVASFHGFGPGPEHLAGDKMRAWAGPRGYPQDPAHHRVFGFNNPDPSPGSPNYGYEFWITVGPEVTADSEAKIMQFAGGLYAVTTCPVRDPWQDIPATWKRLVAWCEGSAYRMAHHQWLEEHLNVPGNPEVQFTLDLYVPIAE